MSDEDPTGALPPKRAPGDLVLELTYYPARGECDQVRLTLILFGLAYHETNVEGKKAAEARANALFGLLPVLEDYDIEVSGAQPIMHYLAERYGPALSVKDKAAADSLCYACQDIQEAIWTADFGEGETQSDLAVTKNKNVFMQRTLAPLLTLLSKDVKRLARESGAPFLFGTQPTHADAALLACLDCAVRELPLAEQEIERLGMGDLWRSIGSDRRVITATEMGQRL